MNIRIRREANALYLRFAEGAVAETAEVRPGVMLDYDAKGRIIGLEVLNASETLAGTDLKRLAVELA